MSFDLYFAGCQNRMLYDWLAKNDGCKLFSQVLERQDIEYWCTKNSGKLFIDSGAYTVYTRNIDLDVDELYPAPCSCFDGKKRNECC